MKIAGSTILVTGASSGIGAELAPMLAARGATVGIVARRRERLAAVLERCREHAPESRMWVADLGDLDGAVQLGLDAWDAFGHLDCVVHNAAIPKRVQVTHLTIADLEETMRINFESPARMTIALLPRMLERGSGLIVNVSSTGGRIPIGNESAYCAAKYALCGWSESMYLDLHGTGVQVKLVLPGPIDTEIWDRPGNEPALFPVEKVPASECAAGIADAIEDDGFEYFVPPVFPGGIDAKSLVLGKDGDCDSYLAGMAELYGSLR